MKRLTKDAIITKIMPQRNTWWPPTNTNTAFTALYNCVDAWRSMLAELDEKVAAVEADADLSGDGIKRKRAELGREAFAALVNHAPFLKAEKTVASNLATLETRFADLPPPPATLAEVANASEIRAHMKAMKRNADGTGSAFAFADKALADPRVTSAWMHASPFQSGLSDVEHTALHAKARKRVNPTSADMIEKLNKALSELHGQFGLDAVKRAVLDRCQLVQRGDTVVPAGESPTIRAVS